MSSMVAGKGAFWRKIAVNFVVGMVCGGGAMILALRLLDRPGDANLHIFALMLGVLLLVSGLFILWAGTSARRTAEAMGIEAEPGEPLGEERRSLVLQGAVTALAGVELCILSLDPTFLNGPQRGLFIAALLLLLAVQTWLNVRIWRSGDEFYRRLLTETALVSFFLFQFLLFFWVVGTRFALVGEPSALDIYVLCMALYLGAGAWIGVRRGVGHPAGE